MRSVIVIGLAAFGAAIVLAAVRLATAQSIIGVSEDLLVMAIAGVVMIACIAIAALIAIHRVREHVREVEHEEEKARLSVVSPIAHERGDGIMRLMLMWPIRFRVLVEAGRVFGSTFFFWGVLLLATAAVIAAILMKGLLS